MSGGLRVIILVVFLLSSVFIGCTNYGYMSAPVSSGNNSATQTAVINAAQTAIAATMTAMPSP